MHGHPTDLGKCALKNKQGCSESLWNADNGFTVSCRSGVRQQTTPSLSGVGRGRSGNRRCHQGIICSCQHGTGTPPGRPGPVSEGTLALPLLIGRCMQTYTAFHLWVAILHMSKISCFRSILLNFFILFSLVFMVFFGGQRQIIQIYHKLTNFTKNYILVTSTRDLTFWSISQLISHWWKILANFEDCVQIGLDPNINLDLLSWGTGIFLLLYGNKPVTTTNM